MFQSNTAKLVRLRDQTVLHVPLSGATGKGEWCTAANRFGPAEQGADHTIKMGTLNDLAMENTFYTLCAQPVHSLPQAL